LEILQSYGGFTLLQFLNDGNLLIMDDRSWPGIIDMGNYEIIGIDADFPTNDSGAAVNAFAISPDGKTIADASISNIIKLTDIDTGEVNEFEYYLSDHPRVEPQAVAFSPDGNFLYVSTPLSFQIDEIIEFDLGKQQVIAEEPNISGIPVFALDGKRLAFRKNVYVSVYTSLLAPWSDHTAVFRADLSDEEGVYYNGMAYAFIKDSSQIGILYRGNVYNYTKDDLRNIGTIIIYNTQDGTVDHFINDIPATSFDLGFNPDGTQFFTLSDEGIQIWQTSDGELLLTSQPYQPDSPIAVSPDGSMYAYIKGDTVQIESSVNGETVIEFRDLNLYMDNYVTFMGNNTVAISSYDHIDTYDIKTGGWIKNYPELSHCDYNRSGNTMICAGSDLKIYDANTGQSLLNIRPSADRYRYTISDDGAYTAFCNENSGSVFLWDTRKGAQIGSLKMNSEPACSWLDFSADGQYLVSSLGAVWQIPDGELLLEIPLHDTEYSPAMDVSPDNAFVLIYPHIYDLENGDHLAEISLIGGHYKGTWFMPDGITIVSRDTNIIQLWQVLE
jgi:WD40 repeat protein